MTTLTAPFLCVADYRSHCALLSAPKYGTLLDSSTVALQVKGIADLIKTYGQTVETLIIDASFLDDKDIVALKGLTHLKCLILKNSNKLTSNFLKELPYFENLETVHIEGSPTLIEQTLTPKGQHTLRLFTHYYLGLTCKKLVSIFILNTDQTASYFPIKRDVSVMNLALKVIKKKICFISRL